MSISFPPAHRVPSIIQALAWGLGLLACLLGMLNYVAEWTPAYATFQFLILVVAPAIWMIERQRALPSQESVRQSDRTAVLWICAGLIGLTSLLTCYWTGRDIVDLPPAYHDEYSYLFQARTLLMGRFSVSSHPSQASLFDQMHVLNEGRMASRYYPGTGLWLAPWLMQQHPYWGHWLASSIASVFVFWTGCELGRLRTGLFSGFACALSPGIAAFSNLLLAHQPTLAALSLFLFGITRWQRTRACRDAALAGCGLSFAMLCRPATAAGIGLPFGIVFLCWLVRPAASDPQASFRHRFFNFIAMGVPILLGWGVMLAYHQNVTGSWFVSPYQLYTEIYTPRHVYGFDNVVRGEQKLGPKVLEAYDRWAQNLTPQLAVHNLRDRWTASWLWSFDLVPLLISTTVFLGTLPRLDRRWFAIGLSIVSLHAMHIPYWYAGIMGWHYVFESVLPWCLILGCATDLLFSEWRSCGRWLMPAWWILLWLGSIVGNYVPGAWLGIPQAGSPRITAAIASIQYPRRQYAEFNRWLDRVIHERPALVLIEIDPGDQHVDYVVNSPDFAGPILRGRIRRDQTNIADIQRAFPNRTIYYCDPKRRILERWK